MAQWQPGQTLDLEIVDLNRGGEGVARWENRVVFVPGGITGDHLRVKLTQVKKRYGQGQIDQILKPSPQRVRPACIVADKCGGCQWQHLALGFQRETKVKQIQDNLARIGGFSPDSYELRPILADDQGLDYRNKVTYPLGRSGSGQVQAGYYRHQSHRIVNLNQCPVQDQRFNVFLTEIKQDIQTQQWSIYQEDKHQGKLRHLALRIGRRSGEVLLTLISTSEKLPDLAAQAQKWLDRYPLLVGVCLNLNGANTNVIFGKKTQLLAGRPYVEETFADLTFQLGPETFFQVNTEVAESLLGVIRSRLNFQGRETVVDAYCGIGTFSLPLAQDCGQLIGIEIQREAIAQARANSQLNGIENVQFLQGTVSQQLPQIETAIDGLILDPPRKGCKPEVLQTILEKRPRQLVYVSCNPSTLARDLKILVEDSGYRLTMVQPADFFPQTYHVETAAFLELIP